MGKPKVGALMRSAGKSARKNSPIFLLVGGIVSSVAAVIMAVRQTAIVKDDIDMETQVKRHYVNDPKAKLTPKEIFLVAWKKYIPVVALLLTSILCILSSSGIVHRRYEALSAAYGVLTAAHNEYVDKVVETVGENKEQTIRNEIIKDKVAEVKQTKTTDEIINTGTGDLLCIDTQFGHQYYSSREAHREVVNRLNYRLTHYDEAITLNDYYEEMHLPTGKGGEYIGWNYDPEFGRKDGLIELDFVSVFANDGVTPALGVGFKNPPQQLWGTYC